MIGMKLHRTGRRTYGFRKHRDLLAVVRTRNVSKAAKILFISQSTVSYRLRLLEEELDCKLVERGRGQNQTCLTKEGDVFPIAERLKNIRYDIESFKDISRHPSISIGCVESMAIYLLDELNNQVAERNNKVKMHFMINNNENIYEMLENGQVDLAYVIEPIRQKNISLTPLFTEQMVLVASDAMKLEGSSIHPNQLDIRDACQFDWKEQNLNTWFEHWFNPKTSLSEDQLAALCLQLYEESCMLVCGSPFHGQKAGAGGWNEALYH